MPAPSQTPPPPEPDPQVRVMKLFAGLAVLGIVLALVIGVVARSDTGNVIALVLGGVASTLLLCLAFYAVGRSEDRDREQQATKSSQR